LLQQIDTAARVARDKIEEHQGDLIKESIIRVMKDKHDENSSLSKNFEMTLEGLRALADYSNLKTQDFSKRQERDYALLLRDIRIMSEANSTAIVGKLSIQNKSSDERLADFNAEAKKFIDKEGPAIFSVFESGRLSPLEKIKAEHESLVKILKQDALYSVKFL